MARGLSDLQKWILVTAYNRRLKAEAEGTYMSRWYGCDLLAANVLDEYYCWKKSGVYNYLARGGRNFDRKTIGSNKYNSVTSILSLTFKGLQNRGLVKRTYGNENVSWSGINLTEEGIAKAKELLVNIRNDKAP
jgi:ribosomal protein S19E (S16A)